MEYAFGSSSLDSTSAQILSSPPPKTRQYHYFRLSIFLSISHCVCRLLITANQEPLTTFSILAIWRFACFLASCIYTTSTRCFDTLSPDDPHDVRVPLSLRYPLRKSLALGSAPFAWCWIDFGGHGGSGVKRRLFPSLENTPVRPFLLLKRTTFVGVCWKSAPMM